MWNPRLLPFSFKITICDFRNLKDKCPVLHNRVIQSEHFGELLVVHVGEPCFASING